MLITVNGQDREIPAGLTVAALLRHLGWGAEERLALERNLEVLPRREWERVRVEENDRYEIVRFVGGGRSG